MNTTAEELAWEAYPTPSKLSRTLASRPYGTPPTPTTGRQLDDDAFERVSWVRNTHGSGKSPRKSPFGHPLRSGGPPLIVRFFFPGGARKPMSVMPEYNLRINEAASHRSPVHSWGYASAPGFLSKQRSAHGIVQARWSELGTGKKTS
ncbi:hypothetical protein GWK47_021867 [Chionoecetes opilio]|uniref:Uncharacterized protein n=1 Tax=Chionoecetes opilio TaxID=41210 RepID=A0A8J5CKD7_CHIOP|nr:hypothetical protein GWK47_021867 [Chionoecetes opilio]